METTLTMSNVEIQEALQAWPRVGRAVQVPRTEADYRSLVSLLDRLVDEVGEVETHPLASLMDLLGVLIEHYEDQHVSELEGTVLG